ncbi:MAG: YkgJ family cysteine cluster protein [Blastocatellia bacterium]|nr:YkgJ family cysteine cluster protein [Blastocatellia bacterium]
MKTSPLSYDLAPESPFGYACHRCGKCCHHQRITLAPYELLRLARGLGLSTGEFIERHTVAGGTRLRFDGPAGACSLLKENGCSAHADRPLACRLYPLGGRFVSDGQARFAQITPHPESAGVYGDAGTVGEFIAAQEIAPFLEASSRYEALFDRLLGLLARYLGRQATVSTEEPLALPLDPLPASSWFDIDAVLIEWRTRRGLAIPETLEAQMDLHLSAMNAWAEDLARLLDR